MKDKLMCFLLNSVIDMFWRWSQPRRIFTFRLSSKKDEREKLSNEGCCCHILSLLLTHQLFKWTMVSTCSLVLYTNNKNIKVKAVLRFTEYIKN